MLTLRSTVVLALLLSSCGAAATPASTGATNGGEALASSETRACPHASAVRYASWAVPSATDLPYLAPGLPTTGFWSIPIGYRIVDDGAPEAGPMTPEALATFGLEAVPSDLFVLRAGAAPCRARVSGYVAELIEDGLANVRVSAISTDCQASEARAIGWVTPGDPSGCEVVTPTRLGIVELVYDDAGTRMPPIVAPVPAPYAAVIPPATCTPPCQTLWRIDVADGPTDVAEIWIDRITPGDPAEPCGWTEIESTPGLYAVGQDGVAHAMPYPDDDGYERAMTLAGVLRDGSGTRVVLFTTHAAWGAFELTPESRLGEGRLVQTFVPNEEDGEYRSLAPYCGP